MDNTTIAYKSGLDLSMRMVVFNVIVEVLIVLQLLIPGVGWCFVACALKSKSV